MVESSPRRNLPPPSRRRDKPQVSCNFCRRRKLRCDRGQPCGSCIHRAVSQSCTYPSPNSNGLTRISRPQRPDEQFSLTERIGKLETLLSSFLEKCDNDDRPRQSASRSSLNNEDIKRQGRERTGIQQSSHQSLPSDKSGHISLRGSTATYVDGAHWSSILNGMTELKDSTQSEAAARSQRESIMLNSSEILFAKGQPTTLEEILEGLPAREVADRLVAGYFNCKVQPLIHAPSFLRHYEKFWGNPTKTPIMWIGKLFGVLCLSLHFQYQSMPEFADHESVAQGYGEKINQCLLLGKYQDCPPDTIEALCFSLNAQVLRSGNTCMDSLIFLGMIVRMAQRMGYHRDASHFPEISPFDGEMRRRVWSQITDLDTLVSAQVGLPRILREFQSDTAPPRNLLDEDFDEHIERLPTPRPDSFETPSQWMVAKNRMISVFGVITDLSTSIKRSDYSEVMRLDKSLRETYSSSPEILLEKPMSRSLMDNSRIILHRIQLILLREKALCVLHYRHLASARTEERYEYSRKTCIESSLRMLEYQWIVETETQPGGRLFEQRWKLSTLLFKNQWILSTSLLCLELNYDISEESKDNSKYIPLSDSIKEQIIQSLRRSYQIFSHSGDDSEGFVKAMQAFRAVFQKIDDQERRPTIDSDEKAVHETANTFGPSPISDTLIQPIQRPDTEQENEMLWHQDMSTPQQPLMNFETSNSYDTIIPELLDLTHSVDEMLGFSMNYPRAFDFPM